MSTACGTPGYVGKWFGYTVISLLSTAIQKHGEKGYEKGNHSFSSSTTQCTGDFAGICENQRFQKLLMLCPVCSSPLDHNPAIQLRACGISFHDYISLQKDFCQILCLQLNQKHAKNILKCKHLEYQDTLHNVAYYFNRKEQCFLESSDRRQ